MTRCAKLLCGPVIGLIAALAAVPGAPVEAKPPGGGGGGGGGGTPPPGTIFFRYLDASDVWGMAGDGSGAGVATSIANDWGRVVPSLGLYGSDGHRWWLATFWNEFKQEQDLYATPDGVNFVQLSDFGYSELVTSESGVMTRTLLRLIGNTSWSNDGLDSFVSFPIVYAEYELNSENQWVRTLLQRAIVQLGLSGNDLEQLTTPFEPVSSVYDERLRPCVVSSNALVADFRAHHWSPDGTYIVYEMRDPTNSYFEFWVADVSGEPVDAEDGALIFAAGNAIFVDPPQWSRHANPVDQRIAFNFAGALRTIRPDGSGLQTLSSEGNTNGDTPYWSPDSQFLVCRRTTQKGFKMTNSIVRIPAAGGAAVVLFTGQAATSKQLVGWCDD